MGELHGVELLTGTGSGHAFCNAHLLRNLEEIIKFEGEPDGWAAGMQP